MGEVYKAGTRGSRREVAIKALLSAGRIVDSDGGIAFMQEARASSALNYPGIVSIYDISHDDGVDFIVMEYVRGRTLDRLIRRQRYASERCNPHCDPSR